jgi:hypothetical protein
VRLEDAVQFIDRCLVNGERNRRFFAANPAYMVPRAGMSAERP